MERHFTKGWLKAFSSRAAIARSAVKALATASVMIGVGIIQATPAFAANIPGTLTPDTQTPEALFEWTTRDNLEYETYAVRRHLADKYPDTAAGMASKGYLLAFDKKMSEAVPYFRRCLETRQIPVANYCAYRMLRSGEALTAEDEAGTLALASSKKENERLLYELYYAEYDYLKDVKKDPAGAERELARWEATNPYKADFLLIRGLVAQDAKDLQRAEASFKAAAALDPKNYWARNSLVRLKIQTVNDGAAPKSNRVEVVDPYTQFADIVSHDGARGKAEAAYALYYAANVLRNALALPQDAAEVFRRAYDLYPTGDTAAAYADTIGHLSAAQYHDDKDSFEKTVTYLRTANQRLPNNPLILKTLADYERRYDLAAAESHYLEALGLPAPAEYLTSAAENLGYGLNEPSNQYEKAKDIYLKYLPLDGDKFYPHLFTNRLAIGRIDEARKILADYEAFDVQKNKDKASTSFFTYWKSALDEEGHEKEKSENYYNKHALMADWQKSFGESLRLSLNFTSGSDQLAPGDLPQLDKVATFLNRADAQDYIFSIEGHTDNVGSADSNRLLSQKRGQSVAAYLNQRHSIAFSRMDIRGVGPDAPIASNLTDAGRYANRRVEVRPLGNTTLPEITATTTMGEAPQLTPDGRLLAVGAAPLQIWDVAKGAKVRELGQAGRARAFSPTGRYIATAFENKTDGGTRNKLVIYDVLTGLTKGGLELDSAAEGFAWNPSGNKLAYITARGLLAIYDLETGGISSARLLPYSKSPNFLVWMRDGKSLAVSYWWGTAIHIFDPDTMKVTHTLSGAVFPHGLGQVGGGRYLVSADDKYNLVAWDSQNWDAAPRRVQSPVTGEIIDNPADSSFFITGIFGEDGKHPLTKFDLQTLAPVATTSLPALTTLSFSPDGKRFYVLGKDAAIEERSSANLRVINSLNATAYPFYNSIYDKKNGLFLTSTLEGTSVWDSATGKRVHWWPDLLVERGAWGDDEFIARQGRRDSPNKIYFLLNTSSFTATKIISDVNFNVNSISLGSQNIVGLSGVPIAAPNTSVQDQGVIEVYDLAAQRKLSRTTVPIMSELLQRGMLTNPYIDADISSDGKLAAYTTRWTDGFSTGEKKSKAVRIVDATTGRLVKRIDLNTGLNYAGFIDNGTHIKASDGSSDYVMDSASGKQISATSTEYSWNLSDKSKITFDSYQLKKVDPTGQARQLWFPGNLGQVYPDEARDLLIVTLSGQAEIEFYKLSALEKRVTLVPKLNQAWIAYTPDGYYAASENGTNKVFWSVGDLLLDFAALKDRFEHPNILSERLASNGPTAVSTQLAAAPSAPPAEELETAGPWWRNIFSTVKSYMDRWRTPSESTTAQTDAEPRQTLSWWQKLLPSGGSSSLPAAEQAPASSVTTASAAVPPRLDPGLFVIPKVTLLSPERVDTTQSTFKFRIKIDKANASIPTPKVIFAVDGQEIGDRDFGISAVKPAEGEISQIVERDFSLSPGKNVLQSSLEINPGVRVATQTSVITYKAPTASIGAGAKVQLWYLGIGVSKYKNPDIALKYAKDDAVAVGDALRKQEGKLFEKVNTKILADEMVDEKTIKKAMFEFLKSAASQDTVIIFIAGHGAQDNDQTLYFVPHDGEPNQPYSWVNINLFQDFLKKRPPQQKALFLLDICHAGAAGDTAARRGQVAPEDAIKQLMDGTGLVVLASSTGKEFSLEDSAYGGGHGAFSAALLEALQGKMPGGANDNIVNVTQLMNFVQRRVPEITKNRQHPTMPLTQDLRDFPIALVK